MKEILQKLVESEVLTEDTQKELREAIEAEINKRVDERVEVKKVELEEQFKQDFFSEREKLVEAIDTFLDCELKGALAESIREEFKREFIAEREKLIEAVDRFLSIELDKKMEMVESTKHAAEVAFYESVRSLMLSEQDVPEEAARIIKELQESLQKKEERINELYGKLIESEKKVEEALIEAKIKDFVQMLPESKRKAARRLLEGVSLEEFDSKAELIASELMEESVGGDVEGDDNTLQESKDEVVVEPSVDDNDDDFEFHRLRQLSGVK